MNNNDDDGNDHGNGAAPMDHTTDNSASNSDVNDGKDNGQQFTPEQLQQPYILYFDSMNTRRNQVFQQLRDYLTQVHPYTNHRQKVLHMCDHG
jgi:Ulp1 family protease